MSTKHLQLTFRRFVARQIIEPFYAMTSISPSSGLQWGAIKEVGTLFRPVQRRAPLHFETSSERRWSWPKVFVIKL